MSSKNHTMKWCTPSSDNLIIVSSLDLICRIYHFQYMIIKVISAGVGFGSRTGTNPVTDWSKLRCVNHVFKVCVGYQTGSVLKSLCTQTSFCHTFTFLYSPSSHPAPCTLLLTSSSSHPPSLHPPSTHPSPHPLTPDTQDYKGVWYVPWHLDRDSVIMPVHQRYVHHFSMSCEIMWCGIMWDHVRPCETMWDHVICRSCDIMRSCEIMRYAGHVTSWDHVRSWDMQVMWHHEIMWDHVRSGEVMWDHVRSGDR